MAGNQNQKLPRQQILNLIFEDFVLHVSEESKQQIYRNMKQQLLNRVCPANAFCKKV
jgi:hypothetical protein